MTRRPKKVLVVEDNVTTRLIVSKILLQDGHEVVIVDNGIEALEALRESTFDIVISDMHMPLMDGLAMCRAYKSRHPEDVTIFTMVSANTDKDSVALALRIGYSHYLQKPVNACELLAAVNGGSNENDVHGVRDCDA